jgi:Asp-tRNA(Asn)/Glu-tRNA(Gln) amidotransferase A subunit family amidase
VTDSGFDRGGALRTQRELLGQKLVRTQALIAAVDAALERLNKGGTTMEKEDASAMFADFSPDQYEAEAEQRWGDTEAYRESKRRTARYGQREWDAIKAESADLFARLAALLAAGAASTSPTAMDLAEEHRQHIERWFYRCPKTMHRALGELYVNDPRFTANIDRACPGVAAYACAAFRANSQR